MTNLTSSHLTSSDFILAGLISSELNSCEAMQFAMAATNHSTRSSDEVTSDEIRSDEIR